MAKDVKDANGLKNKPLMNMDSPKVKGHADHSDCCELNFLLPPRRGGMSRNSEKVRRKVQWNDNNGNKLVEVLEFEPR